MSDEIISTPFPMNVYLRDEAELRAFLAEHIATPDVRGQIARGLQERNRHIDMATARYYVDAVCDLLPTVAQRELSGGRQ